MHLPGLNPGVGRSGPPGAPGRSGSCLFPLPETPHPLPVAPPPSSPPVAQGPPISGTPNLCLCLLRMPAPPPRKPRATSTSGALTRSHLQGPFNVQDDIPKVLRTRTWTSLGPLFCLPQGLSKMPFLWKCPETLSDCLDQTVTAFSEPCLVQRQIL